MKHSSDSRSSKPSLEALLRLKREERPDEAFWSDFEVRLRQKQLAAIIEPKPWWLGASLVLRRFSLPAVVVTAGAAAVFTVVAVRNGAPVMEPGLASVSSVQVASAMIADADAGSVQAPRPESESYVSTVDVATAPAPAFARVAETETMSMAAVATPVSAPAGIVSADLLETSPESVAIAAADGLAPATEAAALAALDASAEAGSMPAAGLIAAESAEPVQVAKVFPDVVAPFELASRDFAVVSWTPERVTLQEDDFGGLAMAGDSGGLAFGASASVQAGDAALPDAAAPAPGSRFERLLSADAPKVVSSGGTLAQVRDRVLHHLGRDEELYASVSRLGVGGDRLSLRF